jgi:heme-degrading monooxygenase HmoA
MAVGQPGAPAGFRVLLTVQVEPGRQADFEREWLAGSGVIAGHPANRGHWLGHSDQDPNVFYVISDWSDEASFREFENSPAHLAHRQRLHPYRAGGSMATMRLLAAGAAVAGARQ